MSADEILRRALRTVWVHARVADADPPESRVFAVEPERLRPEQLHDGMLIEDASLT